MGVENIRLPPTLELARPLNCLLAGVAVLIGAVVTVGHANIPGLTLISAFAAAALVAAGGNAINDYFDRKIDRINRPERPIPAGRIKASEALIMAQVLFVLGVVLTVFLNPYCVLLAGFNALVLAFYAWGLKRRGLAGNFAIGYLVGSTFLFGGLATAHLRAGPLIPTELLVLVLMAALSTVGRELIKSIQDMRGDRKLGFKTLPLMHGAGKAAALAVGFMGAAIALSPLPYLLGIFGPQYLALVAASIAAFIAAAGLIARSQEPKAAGRASLACKIGMGLGLLAFLVGVFIL
ncbi:MAG: geranylgeranylglycerol-phosphate geranylgeranyltransferase [Candidatus Hodarchaeaceae archaeon]|nr:geranylgeranylglycerol-phosphate geranylgeranyltransferase [Candidatus Hodarchaeaceae archaeon]